VIYYKFKFSKLHAKENRSENQPCDDSAIAPKDY